MTRVQIPAYTDRWMMGDRYGEITGIHMSTTQMLEGQTHWDTVGQVEIAHVKLDKSGKTVRVILADCEVIP